jgi:hypothetical protein
MVVNVECINALLPVRLHEFIREDLLQDHEPHCCQHGAHCIELSNEDNASLYFKDYHKQLKVPFVTYADFKSVTTKIDSVSSKSN